MRGPTKALKIAKINKHGLFWSLLSLAILSVAYYLCLKAKSPSMVEVFSNILVVLISIIGTNLLTGFLVETKGKDQLISDILVNDVIASDEFLEMLPQDKKDALAQNIDRNLRFDGNAIKAAMLDQARLKISAFSDIYYSSCVYTVKCTIYQDRIEKHIKKTMKLRTSQQQAQLSDITLCSMSFAPTQNYSNDLKPRVQINGQQVREELIRVKDKPAPQNPYDEKSGYTVARDYVYTKKLNLSPNKDTTIVVESDTVVPPNDLTYVCRMKRACKNFELQYVVNSHTDKKYRVNLSAFGFVDNASGTTNTNDDPTHVNVKFDDWIYPEDGVVVVMVEDT